MIQTIKKAWAIPELRKKIVFTALMLLIFRIGNAIPVPYVNTELLGEYLNQLSTTVLGLYNVMSGGAFANATVFALGVQPYINSSIIIQLLTIAIPALERMARDGGEEGKKKIQSITRYATVAIAILQGWGYYVLMKNYGILTGSGVWVALVIIISFIAGSSFVMWMGEQITEFGIGNGISMLLFAGILARFPVMAGTLGELTKNEPQRYFFESLGILILFIAMIAFIVFMNASERRIPIQYAKRVVGRKQYGGQSTHIPVKVCMSGVMPIIFAMSFMSLPSTISLFKPVYDDPTGFWQKFYNGFINFFNTRTWTYALIYFILIIAFNYFYVSMQYNPIEIANNLRQSNGGIPGIRPGKPTSDYIQRVLSKITLVGAFFLGIIAIFPIALNWMDPNLSSLAMGGTTILIVVSVALETVRTLESEMMMRHHKGFLE